MAGRKENEGEGSEHYIHGRQYALEVRFCFSFFVCERRRRHRTGRQRRGGCLIFIRYFPQKSPIIGGSLARNDLQLKAFYGSWPHCTGIESCHNCNTLQHSATHCKTLQ